MAVATTDIGVTARQFEIATAAKPELRVLHVFSSLGMGGAETWLISLLRYFHDHAAELPVRVKLDVLLTGGEKSLLDDEAKALGARLFYLRFGKRSLVSFVKGFRRILAEGNYDAIHDHQDYIAGVHFFLGAGLLPPARIAHVHNPYYHRSNATTGMVARTINRTGKSLISRMATHVMGTSRQIIGEYGFHESTSSNVQLDAAHCGFDVNEYLGDRAEAHRAFCEEMGWPNSSRIVFFIGRLSGAEMLHNGQRMTHKNPAFALEVGRECIARDSRICLAMVGDGEEKKTEFEHRIAGWGLTERISLLGVRFDVPKLLLGADLLLFPSLAEGLGMVVVEAQAAGLRVLASDSTPNESVVIPELIGFLSLDAGPAKWASEVLRLIEVEAPDLRKCNARISDSAFSIQNSAAKLVGMYSSARSN